MSEEQELAEFQEWLTEERADRIVALSRKMHGREGGPAMTTRDVNDYRAALDLDELARKHGAYAQADSLRLGVHHHRVASAISQARAEEREAIFEMVREKGLALLELGDAIRARGEGET